MAQLTDDDQPVNSPLATDRAVPVGQTKEADQRHSLHVRVKNPGDFPGGGGATVAFTTLDQAQKTIADDSSEVEAKVGGARLANRNGIYIENTSTFTLFYGKTGVGRTGVTQGPKLFPSQSVFLAAGDVGIFVVTDEAAGATFVVQEFGST